jgi:hypothetical protein
LGASNEGLVIVAGKDLAALFAACDGDGVGSAGLGGAVNRGRRRLLPTHCGDVLVEVEV